MPALEESTIECPYCGEWIDVLIDTPVDEQTYIEDCQVCCRPINFKLSVDMAGVLRIIVSDENESI